MACSLIWQLLSDSLCPPVVLSRWTTAAAPAKTSAEGAAPAAGGAITAGFIATAKEVLSSLASYQKKSSEMILH